MRRDSEEVPPSAFGGRLARTLVRILAIRRGSFVSRDYLSEALWRARPPRDPAANLRVLVNRARAALGDAGLIETGSGGYAFDVERHCGVDTETFMAKVEAGRQRLASGQARAGLVELRAALELWKEPLPEDVYEEWAQEYRGQLLRAHLETLETAAEACLAVDDARQAVVWAEQAAAREPLRETANLLLVQALALAGDTAGALDAYNCFRRRLAEELGLDPSPEAAELETRILRGEPLRPRLRRPIVSPLPPQPVELAFVGREHEIDTILGHLKQERAATLEVIGHPGVGKTRLLWEVGIRAGMAVVSARAFPGDREEPWSLARSLLGEALSFDLEAARALPPRAAQALSDIVPELEQLHATESGPLDPESRRALALQGALHLLQAASATGLLVVIDDLHWVDTTSLALLRRLVPQASRPALMFAYRPEEIPLEGPLASFLHELPRLAPTLLRVPVEPLSPDALATLIADTELARVIAEETDRTPLAVGEVLRALAERGVVHADAQRRWHPRSHTATQLAGEAARAGKRQVISSRVQAQPPLRRQLLSLLALVGREVPARLLASACGIEQIRVLEGLEQLGGARLVQLGEHAWGVAHPLIAQTVAENLKRPERALLHGMLARALALEGGDLAEVARHLAAAGDSQAAAEAFMTASRHSLDHFASEEAEQLADAGLRLDPNPSTASVLLEIRAEARARRGDHAGACDDFRAALADRTSASERARILARLAMVILGDRTTSERTSSSTWRSWRPGRTSGRGPKPWPLARSWTSTFPDSSELKHE
ncbi:MAG: BTAD domain-containing putative transcriptional regulator [Nitriliruptorales bacterium]